MIIRKKIGAFKTWVCSDCGKELFTETASGKPILQPCRCMNLDELSVSKIICAERRSKGIHHDLHGDKFRYAFDIEFGLFSLEILDLFRSINLQSLSTEQSSKRSSLSTETERAEQERRRNLDKKLGTLDTFQLSQETEVISEQPIFTPTPIPNAVRFDDEQAGFPDDELALSCLPSNSQIEDTATKNQNGSIPERMRISCLPHPLLLTKQGAK